MSKKLPPATLVGVMLTARILRSTGWDWAAAVAPTVPASIAAESAVISGRFIVI